MYGRGEGHRGAVGSLEASKKPPSATLGPRNRPAPGVTLLLPAALTLLASTTTVVLATDLHASNTDIVHQTNSLLIQSSYENTNEYYGGGDNFVCTSDGFFEYPGNCLKFIRCVYNPVARVFAKYVFDCAPVRIKCTFY